MIYLVARLCKVGEEPIIALAYADKQEEAYRFSIEWNKKNPVTVGKAVVIPIKNVNELVIVDRSRDEIAEAVKAFHIKRGCCDGTGNCTFKLTAKKKEPKEPIERKARAPKPKEERRNYL